MSAPTGEARAAADARAPQRKVLVADDRADCADPLAEYLRAAGHMVRVVRGGSEAIDAVLADPPDVMFLDLGMPGRDGWEVAAAARRALAGRPCLLVAVSGFADEVDRDRSAAAGFDLHVSKPADPAALLRLVAEGRPGPEPAPPNA